MMRGTVYECINQQCGFQTVLSFSLSTIGCILYIFELLGVLSLIDIITALRRKLHDNPEISGQEYRTQTIIKEFLHTHTTLEIQDLPGGFYAAHRENDAILPGIAFRADYDALATPDGGAAHLCGHDGHAAALCVVALEIEGKHLGRNVFLLFQGAEENGAGAAQCLSIFSRESIGEIYGAHNLPGLPFGTVHTRSGTFACGSRGMTITFRGKPSHAAYPEHGISPAPAVGQLLCALPRLAASALFSSMTMCTVIGVNMGEKAFGAAAESAQIWLTLRSRQDEDLDTLQASILNLCTDLANTFHLAFSYDIQDVFPATVNDPGCTQRILDRSGGCELPEPMRWSEDFGHYLRNCPGAFFGIGAGTDHPALHTEDYEYPDALLMPTVEAFLKLI